MADKKISELTELTTLAAADEFAVVDDDVATTKRVTYDTLATEIRTEAEALSGTTGTFSGALSATTGTFSGLITANAGVKLAASQGIDFSAYGVGTDIDSNLLDDYEEGTWDPTYVLGTSGTATVDASTVGNYVKVGNAVHVTCRIATASINSPTGDLKIDGLPFTSKTTGGLSGAALGVVHSWATNKLALRAYVADNDDRISLVKNATNAAFLTVVGSDLDSGSAKNVCVLQLTYLVD